MSQPRENSRRSNVSKALISTAIFALALLRQAPLHAQGAAQGPLAEPPADHHVMRIGTEAEPPAPPSLPEAEIIKKLSQKEDEYLVSRTHYSYKKTIRIQEFGIDGKPSGEFVLVTQPAKDVDGKVFDKVVERPQSSLTHVFLRAEDLEGLQKIPAYPLTTSQLAKYNLKYEGKEQVDEIECYIFQVKPKVVERTRAYFDGIVWVDTKYLEVVKTYGRWMTDQGAMKAMADLPFTMFETYRENVDGKYWFPSYSRSDETMNLKGGLEIPVRVVIKWTDFKALSNAPEMKPSEKPGEKGAAQKPDAGN